MRAQNLSMIKGFLDIAHGSFVHAQPQRPLRRREALRLYRAQPCNHFARLTKFCFAEQLT